MLNLESEGKKNNAFGWVEYFPMAASIIDINTLDVITCNSLFSEMIDPTEVKMLNEKLIEVKEKNGSKSIITLKSSETTIHLLINIKTINVDGKELLLSTYEDLEKAIGKDSMSIVKNDIEKISLKDNVQIIILDENTESMFDDMMNRIKGLKVLKNQMEKSDENTVFTLVYFTLEGLGASESDEKGSIESALNVVRNGIRKTDIIFNADGDDYILIFPECRYEVADSIMGTIAKKIYALNESPDLKCSVAIEYAISEYDSKKKQTPEQFIEDVKKEI